MAEGGLSKELAAMVQIEHSLTPLSPEECTRVLTWAGARFGVTIAATKKAATKGGEDAPEENAGGEAGGAPPEAATIAEFYDRASPASDGEKALVIGYWFQYRDGVNDLEAHKINSALKHLGHGIGNVTRALDWLKDHKPALMIQKRKEGTSKQARKKFAVTGEGKKYVDRLLSRVQSA
jgi:hypothetical protein